MDYMYVCTVPLPSRIQPSLVEKASRGQILCSPPWGMSVSWGEEKMSLGENGGLLFSYWLLLGKGVGFHWATFIIHMMMLLLGSM